MEKSFKRSRDAYNRGNSPLGLKFMTNGKRHEKKMEALDQKASDWVFKGGR
jgi:Domain of unknown function (DUF1771)